MFNKYHIKSILYSQLVFSITKSCFQDRLAMCEKALAEYLETKRLAFPRFYFISSADLLDILSKGNQPLLVARHLSKLFDNLHRLEFKKVNFRDISMRLWLK